MPFAHVIDYPSASVVFNISDTSRWVPQPPQWTIDGNGFGKYPGDAQWWLPDADVSDISITVRTYVSLAARLAALDRQDCQ